MPSAEQGLEESLDRLEGGLGYRFAERDLLKLALTHPSRIQEGEASFGHNQRLEFLGDAVLQAALTHELYLRFSAASEGYLTQVRSRLVNRHCLADQARRLELGRHLRLGKNAENLDGRRRPAILGDAFEAVIGAVFLDAGFQTARRLVVRLFEPDLADLRLAPGQGNPKGELQEYLQSRSAEPIRYRQESATGPHHDRSFVCSVWQGEKKLGQGVGKSKKSAESQAAREALDNLQNAGRAGGPAEAPRISLGEFEDRPTGKTSRPAD